MRAQAARSVLVQLPLPLHWPFHTRRTFALLGIVDVVGQGELDGERLAHAVDGGQLNDLRG